MHVNDDQLKQQTVQMTTSAAEVHLQGTRLNT